MPSTWLGLPTCGTRRGRGRGRGTSVPEPAISDPGDRFVERRPRTAPPRAGSRSWGRLQQWGGKLRRRSCADPQPPHPLRRVALRAGG
jgi:hypothetical protein